MIYIIYNPKIYNISPEIDYGGGITMQFKKGYFLFDENDTSSSFYTSGEMIYIDGDDFSIDKNLIFNNKVRAEIRFLQLKLIEMKESSFDFFLPKTFSKHLNRFESLMTDYPEWTI